MLDTAVAQLWYAASLVLGRPFSPWSLDHIIAALQATRREFGAPGAGAAELPRWPGTRRGDAPGYARAALPRPGPAWSAGDILLWPPFARLDLDPARLRYDDILRVPPTTKDAVRDDPDAFVRRTARPTLRTTTTGTTGWPTSVSFSEREIQTTIALATIGLLVHGQITAEDIVQISTSSRATLGNTCFAGACTRIGALWCMGGLVEPALTLAQLAQEHHIAGKKPRASVLTSTPRISANWSSARDSGGIGRPILAWSASL